MPSREVKEPNALSVPRSEAFERMVHTNPAFGALGKAYACFNPYRPSSQAIDEGKREVCNSLTASTLALSRPTFLASFHR